VKVTRTGVHVLAAVTLSLAVGIALGGGPLTGNHRGDAAPSDEPTSATSTPAPPAPTDYAAEFAGAGASRLYANGLFGHATAVLAMPGADQATVDALLAQVDAAGGASTGTYTVGAALVDPAQRATLDQVGSGLAGQLNDPRLNPAAGTYELMGQVLGLAMATKEQSSVRADPAAYAARTALADAGLLTSPKEVRSAPLVLIVLPPGTTGGAADEALLSGLANGLGSTAAGVVVVGDEESATSGDLAALRGTTLSGPVSTVDGVETVLGQMTAVLALTAVLSGSGGSYGASGANGPVPLT
jgi:hypothetical protein